MDVLIRLSNALLMIAIPLGLGWYLQHKWSLSWRVFLVGAATFVGSQVLHIPFNLFVLTPIADNLDLIGSEKLVPLVTYAILLGLSAGVFEEGARYLVYRLWLKNVTLWKEAVFFGAGHGGMEAMLLGGLALYTFFQATAYRNADLSQLVSPEQMGLAQAQLDAYWSAPWYAAIMGAVERSLAIVIQISLAVMVFQAFIEKKGLWLGIAVLWHTIIDAMAVAGVQYWGIYLTEGVLFILAGISLWGILILKRRHPEEDPSRAEKVEPVPDRKLPSGPIETDITEDGLEASRYSH
jgi:uncharacterized membrane protein YhfC